MSRYDAQEIELPLGWMLEQARDWDALCDDLGICSYVMADGRAMGEDTHPITIGMAKKHGLLCGG